jgi:hypothetical protein
MYGIQASFQPCKRSIRTANVTEDFCRKRVAAVAHLQEYRLKNPKHIKVISQKRDIFYGNLPVDL